MSRLPDVPQLSFLGSTLQPAILAKDLGIILDRHLTYDHNITYLVSSCFSKLRQINRVKKNFNKKTYNITSFQ